MAEHPFQTTSHIKTSSNEFLPLRRDTAYIYASLTLNEAQDHRAPSDHVIIAHAITEHLTLLSSDQKFAFYCGRQERAEHRHH